jgi:predicted nucleotidyltransferase
MTSHPDRLDYLKRAIFIVVKACRKAFKEELVCVILKGSAVKGDFIPGYSDLDFHVFLKPEAIDGEKSPNLDDAITFQRLMGTINPQDFGASQFQVFFLNAEKYPKEWLPPTAGTYKIVWGRTPPALQTLDDATYVRYARQFLGNVDADKQNLIGRFIDKPNSRAPAIVRLLGTTLKGHLYSVSMLLLSQPKTALRMKLGSIIPLVEESIGSIGHISRFFAHVSDWSRIQETPELARDAFREGIAALEEISTWIHQKMQ